MWGKGKDGVVVVKSVSAIVPIKEFMNCFVGCVVNVRVFACLPGLASVLTLHSTGRWLSLVCK